MIQESSNNLFRSCLWKKYSNHKQQETNNFSRTFANFLSFLVRMADMRHRRVTSLWTLVPLLSVIVTISSGYPSLSGFLPESSIPQSPLLHRSEPRSPWYLPQSISSISYNRQVRSGTRFCGENLVSALQLVCGGVYKKRSPRPETWKMVSDDDKLRATGMEGEWSRNFHLTTLTILLGDEWIGEEQSDLDGDWTTDISLLMKRSEVGVVDECCKKSCPLSTLRTYCGTKQKKKRSSSNGV